MIRALFAVALIAMGIATAEAADTPQGIVLGETAKGPTWTDSKGMSLYTFDEDPDNGSVCFDKCAKNWPPATAAEGAGPVGGFTVIDREDGIRQWAYKGRALYGWVRDKKPGDITGDGFRNWRLAKP